jgi:Domain of unknown function (DUF4292)
LLQTQSEMRFAFCRYGTLLIVFFSLGLVSCSKKTLPTVTIPPRVVTATLTDVPVEEIDFGYMHGKARMVYKDDKKEREVKAHIRVRKDSVIWMTFTVVGVQGGRALINQDSITIVSTVDKEYFVFDYKELSKRFHFDVNYKVIEAAILGNLIHPKNGNDVFSQKDSLDIIAQSQGEVSIKNFVNRRTQKIEKVELIEPTSGNALNIDYSDFQPLGNKNFPYNNVINVVYKTVNGIINNTIIVEFNKAEVGDKELKFPFKIPPKYDRR